MTKMADFSVFSFFMVFFWLSLTGCETINIDGKWSPWSNLDTDCIKIDDSTGLITNHDVKCGGGVKRRTRSCTNPKVYIKYTHMYIYFCSE